MSDEQVKGIPMDFPEAWAFVRTTKLEDHHMRCSWRSGLLCDCNVLWAEYYKRKAARSEQALAALEGRNAELKAALRRLIGACVRPNGMLQPPDVDSEYAARAALAAPDGQKEK